ncbi:MAG: C4-dicarboxylate ABC transporter substrate-binding protein [Pseudooceanicola sp.]|jgi:TRAP-type C4-dicarboxylate transport system substrate-binding protein|nr:C4-dicarboxylate ABC transporter substrate-binding protein [Pseudooceanicola sp.]
MKPNLRTKLAASAAAIALACTAGSASAQQMLSTWLEPNHIITIEGHQGWAELVKEATNGEIDFEVFVGGALIPAKSTMQGTADGLAQVGFHTATYTPTDLPVANALADMGFETPDAYVMSFAFGDFMMNDEEGYNDWRKNGVIFGGSYSTPIYYFICREPVKTLEDIQGKRVRMPGGGWARFGQEIGVVGVNVPSSEIYTAFERGSVDCTASDPTHLTSGATLQEVAKSVTMLKMSPFYAGVTYAYNPTFWQGLSEEQRRTLFDQSALAMARMQITYDKAVESSLEEAKANGIEMVEPDASLQSAYDDWVAGGVGGMADIAKDTHGIDDPEALYSRFREYVAKWEGLLDGVDRHDEEAIAGLIRENLFDPIDVATYGID